MDRRAFLFAALVAPFVRVPRSGRVTIQMTSGGYVIFGSAPVVLHGGERILTLSQARALYAMEPLESAVTALRVSGAIQ